MMSGLNPKKNVLGNVAIDKFVHNIEKLKRILSRIFAFDNCTSLKILEAYEQLLETNWKRCTFENIEGGNDIPFDDTVFWWRTNGDIRYQAACERLTFLIISCKAVVLTKTHTFTSFHRLIYQIYQFDQSTSLPMIHLSVELLEHYWLQFSEAYSDMVKGNAVPTIVANVYFETQSIYINCKIKTNFMLLNRSQGFMAPQKPQNVDDFKAEGSIEPQTTQNVDDLISFDYIVESIDRKTPHENLNETTDDEKSDDEKSDDEKSDDSTTKSHEELNGPIIQKKEKIFNLLFLTLRRLMDWVRLFWRKKGHTSETITNS